MVDQSDLPFRLLARKYGTTLAYTPMLHAKMFLTSPAYAAKMTPINTPASDRPLIVQFCGNDKDILLEAAKIVEASCDAIDLNCGCPQGIAKRGNYGAFLLEESDLLVSIVKHLAENLKCPVTVKVRILPTGIKDSLALYTRLIDAGASLLAVHGRTRHQKGQLTGTVDWSAIRKVVETLGHRIPIIANGGISCMEEVTECLLATGARGVMSSEAILEYPALFAEDGVRDCDGRTIPVSKMDLTRQYLDLCKLYPSDVGGQGNGMKCTKAHFHKFLFAELQENAVLRDALVAASTLDEYYEVLAMCEAMTMTKEEAGSATVAVETGNDDAAAAYGNDDNDVLEEREWEKNIRLLLVWYFRHRNLKSGIGGPSLSTTGKGLHMEQVEISEDTAECFSCLFTDDDSADGGDY
jgi:tRNA-dihydrouridine synthase 1